VTATTTAAHGSEASSKQGWTRPVFTVLLVATIFFL
jgi:hypothetical protein